MRQSLLRMLALIRKELLAIFSDPRSRYVLFVPPVVQCLIFGYAATYDLNTVPYAVLDQDRSAASEQFLAKLDGSGIFQRVATLTRASDITAIIDNQRALLVIQIGQDFARELHAGRDAEIQVVADGRNSNTAATALGYVDAAIDSFNADWAADHGRAAPPLQATMRAWYNPNLETRWYMIPALIGTLTMLQTMLLTAMSVAREREQGTFDQLLVTPFRPAEIMVGKAVPSMIIGYGQATSILLVAQGWFRIPFAGSYATLFVGLGLFLLAAVGIGLMLSSVVASMQQATLYSFVLMMPLALLSGLATPIRNMPMILQDITLGDPLRFGIEIAQRVYLEGVGLDRLVGDIVPLLTIAALTLTGASWMFRRGIG